MMIAEPNNENWVVDLSPRQSVAWKTIWLPETLELLFGGAKYGGKSFFGVHFAYAYCIWVIEHFNLKPTENPIPLGWMGRVRGSDFQTTTFESWKEEIPSSCYRLHQKSQSSGEIIIRESVKIFYGGLDNTEQINKFNSAQFGFFFLDQSEEATPDQVGELRAALRRTIAGKPLPFKALFTANPSQCFLKEEFIVRKESGKAYVCSLPTDNPVIIEWAKNNPGKEHPYISQLKAAFKHRPALLEAYLHGSWDITDDAEQCIKESWLRAATTRRMRTDRPRRFLICDVARFGDDRTVIYLFEETDVIKTKVYGKKDLMHTASILHISAVQEGVDAVAVDEIGLGGGVVDRLREMSDGQYEVFGINVDQKSEMKVNGRKVYGNLRAEIYDQAAIQLESGDVQISNVDQELWTELTIVKIRPKNGLLYVEKKEEIKKRLGRSPDKADTYVIGLWLRDKVVAKEHKERRRRSLFERNRAVVSAMAS